jgi:mannose-6-phosphate isomerase-like protein (cupin superfamily)
MDLENSLLKCWSIKTSSKWTIENPYKGQCSVTSIVMNDLLGGKILKTKVDDQWHYYNLINGQRLDYTSKQFDYNLNYQDIDSSWDEAYSDTTEFQYKELKGLMAKELFGIVDIANAKHYEWGDKCDGWHFVKTDSLSIIKETMPGKTKEQLHYHEKAQQFFYILSGVATFEINGFRLKVEQNTGIHITPGFKHMISNNTETDLEFLVISEPKSHGDRINIEEKSKR